MFARSPFSRIAWEPTLPHSPSSAHHSVTSPNRKKRAPDATTPASIQSPPVEEKFIWPGLVDIMVMWPGLRSKPRDFGVPPDLCRLPNLERYDLSKLGERDLALLQNGERIKIKISRYVNVKALKM